MRHHRLPATQEPLNVTSELWNLLTLIHFRFGKLEFLEGMVIAALVNIGCGIPIWNEGKFIMVRKVCKIAWHIRREPLGRLNSSIHSLGYSYGVLHLYGTLSYTTSTRWIYCTSRFERY